MNPLNHEEAVDQVVEYLDSLSEAEFDKFLDSHGNGDFAVMLRETGALEAQMEESQMLGRALVPAMALPILWAETASLNVPIYYGMTKTSMPVSPAFYLAARSFIGDVACQPEILCPRRARELPDADSQSLPGRRHGMQPIELR